VDDHLKKLIQELGNAISESLSDSDRIDDATAEIGKEGYDVFLFLEATIGFNQRNTKAAVMSADEPLVRSEVSFSRQDRAFLKALKIKVDD